MGGQGRGAWAAPRQRFDDLAAAPIVVAGAAPAMERFSALELQRYLYRMTGRVPTICDAAPPRGLSIVLGTPGSQPLVHRWSADGRLATKTLGEQGYHLKSFIENGRRFLVVASRTPVGVLYGTYDLLERLGAGFYFGGDVVPSRRDAVPVPKALDAVMRPAFGIRGSALWPNTLCGTMAWDREDFEFFFEQMAKQRLNFVAFHSYDMDPYAPYPWKGKLMARAQPPGSSLDYHWGLVRGLGTAQFGFGTGDYFDRDPFGARSLLEGKDRDDKIGRTTAVLAGALAYARGLGIKAAVGFELESQDPWGPRKGRTADPTDPAVAARLEARLQSLLTLYPMADHVWLWQAEGLGRADLLAAPPPEDSPLGRLVTSWTPSFAYLKSASRIAEAVRFGHSVEVAYRILERLAPGKKLVVGGWGGDQHMYATDYYEGLDRTLPRDIIFGSLDNLDIASAPTVSAVYGKLSPGRERWPVVWWEADGGSTVDWWSPNASTRRAPGLCRDALAKKCQGFLAMHWRFRDLEEILGYQARFSWDPSLTYQRYYDQLAARWYGQPWAKAMSLVHRQLEDLGPRWTGGRGVSEIDEFVWYSEGQLPSKDKIQALEAIRARVASIHDEMVASGKTEGRERIEWLLTTMDWMLRYDAAAPRLWAGGSLARQVSEAEQAKVAGDPAAADKARDAYRALLRSGLREALQTYARKVSTMGELGTLATINIKAYASFLKLTERLRRVNPNLPPLEAESQVGPDEPPRVIMKIPSSTAKPGAARAVRAAVIAGKPLRSVRLRYRTPGAEVWTEVPMELVFRRTYGASIPPAAVTEAGIEYFVEAEDDAGRKAYAPIGYPAATWTATGAGM